MPIYKKIYKNFFKKWTPDMAYVLGFIYADGNIIHTKRGTWFWSIQITDEDILRACLKSSKKLLFGYFSFASSLFIAHLATAKIALHA